MRIRLLPLALAAAMLPASAEKLTQEDRIEILRGLTAEFATAKVQVPRSRKSLEFRAEGSYNKAEWNEAFRENGPAARVGDQVQVTKVSIEDDKLILEINGGLKSKKKWYERVEVGMGGNTRPIGNSSTNAPGGTQIALVFPKEKGVPVAKASEFKKMLAPILDFDKQSATEQYIETLPPEIKQAIADKKAVVGMDRDQLIMALGRPRRKSRETDKTGLETEDWIYGEPPGKMTFVTIANSKVIRVKETYAGLGGSTVPTPTVP